MLGFSGDDGDGDGDDVMIGKGGSFPAQGFPGFPAIAIARVWGLGFRVWGDMAVAQQGSPL